MFLGPPPPRNGLPLPTSGVAVIGIDPIPRPLASGSPPFRKSTAKAGNSGLLKFGWLKILKKSTRNCAATFSENLKFLANEKSNCLKVGPRKAFLPRLPKCCVPETHEPLVAFQVHGTAKADASRKRSGRWRPLNGLPTTSGRPKNSSLPL